MNTFQKFMLAVYAVATAFSGLLIASAIFAGHYRNAIYGILLLALLNALYCRHRILRSIDTSFKESDIP